MLFDMERFKNPTADDRIHPFWFWNGELEDEQLICQIHEMARQGLGGFFICARQGLKIPYLSDSWFQKVRVAVEAAKECGMHVWLYDEYPYPSGIAGGEVILEHPEAKHYTLARTSYRARGGEHLSLELPWARILYAKAAPVTANGKPQWNQAMSIRSWIGNYQADQIFQKAGLTAYNQKRFFTYRTVQKLDWQVPPGEWEVLIVQEKELDDFKYFGTFVDPCNKEAMATFIRLTHDKYVAYLGEYLGTTIKGMFTDEIGLLGDIPWSPQLPAYFKERCGYDLLEHLYALIHPDTDEGVKIKYDYYQSVHLLLRESYHQQVHDWCERHGLQYVAEVPSVRHTTQLFSHIPAGDSAHEKLGRSLEWILNAQAEHFRCNAKMISSLARQLNRERNLVECFHSVGWSMTLQDARWMIDRMAAQGTNMFNFHAFFYTIDGLAQHDAPPSQFLQNPYWKHFRKLSDYVGRISYVMSTGEAVISAAVLEPVTSLWTRLGNPFHGFSYSGELTEEKEQLEHLKRWWMSICNRMTKDGRDFDHLDPELLVEAEVENGTIKLGKACYSLLVLPPMTNLENNAWEKVKQFVEQGGAVVSMGQLPYESIEVQGADHSGMEQVFGVPGTWEAKFWSPHPQRQDQLRWFKGKGTAYHLPFHAQDEPEHVMEMLSAQLNKLDPLPVQLLPACGEWGLLMQVRRISADKVLVFISNQEEALRDVKLQVNSHVWGEGEVCRFVAFRELSLDDGDVVDLLHQAFFDRVCHMDLQMEPYSARLIEITRGGDTLPANDKVKLPPCKLDIDASSLWELRPLSANTVRFDTFRMTISSKKSSNEGLMEGTRVQVKTFIDQVSDLSEAAALPVTTWQSFGTPMKLCMDYPLLAHYEAEFIVEELLENSSLLMDLGAISGTSAIRVNGHLLDVGLFQPTFLYDHRNISHEITDYLQVGINLLEVDVEICQDGDGLLDALYVTGPFQVLFDDKQRHILSPASLSRQPVQGGPYQGYPYYAGDLSFRRTFELPALPEEAIFELNVSGWDPHFHDCAEITVNGQSIGVRPWSPYRWKGNTEYLQIGANTVEIIVTNTLIGLLDGKYFDYAEHVSKPVQERVWNHE